MTFKNDNYEESAPNFQRHIKESILKLRYTLWVALVLQNCLHRHQILLLTLLEFKEINMISGEIEIN